MTLQNEHSHVLIKGATTEQKVKTFWYVLFVQASYLSVSSCWCSTSSSCYRYLLQAEGLQKIKDIKTIWFPLKFFTALRSRARLFSRKCTDEGPQCALHFFIIAIWTQCKAVLVSGICCAILYYLSDSYSLCFRAVYTAPVKPSIQPIYVC